MCEAWSRVHVVFYDGQNPFFFCLSVHAASVAVHILSICSFFKKKERKELRSRREEPASCCSWWFFDFFFHSPSIHPSIPFIRFVPFVDAPKPGEKGFAIWRRQGRMCVCVTLWSCDYDTRKKFFPKINAYKNRSEPRNSRHTTSVGNISGGSKRSDTTMRSMSKTRERATMGERRQNGWWWWWWWWCVCVETRQFSTKRIYINACKVRRVHEIHERIVLYWIERCESREKYTRKLLSSWHNQQRSATKEKTARNAALRRSTPPCSGSHTIRCRRIIINVEIWTFDAEEMRNK